MTCRNILALAIALLAPLGAQPTWTQIMDATGYSNENSAEYFQFNASLGTNPTTHPNTDTALYSSMTVPFNGSVPETAGGNDVAPCTTSTIYPSYYIGPVPPNRVPSMYLRSYYGPSSGSYKGLAFYGAFNTSYSPGCTTSGYTCDAIETAFFHENECYAGGREYGVSYSFYYGTISFYASTYTNCTTAEPSPDCTVNEASDTWTVPSGLEWSDGNYFFEIWPVSITVNNQTTCGFNLSIIGPPPDYTTEWTSGPQNNNGVNNVPSNSISADPTGFCSAIESESGYYSAGLVYNPTVYEFQYYAPYLSLGIQGIYAGK